MNTLLSHGLTNLLFSVIEQETSRILAENHDDESALNRRVARILAMAHNQRALDAAGPQDPLLVLGRIESEAVTALRESPGPQDIDRLNAVVETAQRKDLLEESGKDRGTRASGNPVATRPNKPSPESLAMRRARSGWASPATIQNVFMPAGFPPPDGA